MGIVDYYRGKKVLITGHTGFKGSWLCKILEQLGSKIYGYSLKTPTDPNLFTIANIDKIVESEEGDIRNYEHLHSYIQKIKPDIIFHLAAQPLVRESYKDPKTTYETNIMGTVNILECCRTIDSIDSLLNVTTDKVYLNLEKPGYHYKESDELKGYDPYSNSKSCSELVTYSYKHSFESELKTAISTARAGNVIGGGDFSKDRIIPDCVRAAINNKKIILRNPNSVRPYQHVLEPLFAYLTIASKQTMNTELQGSYNVGPNICDCVSTGDLTTMFCKEWGDGLTWYAHNSNGPHEANYLMLDSSLIQEKMNYKPVWGIQEAIKNTIDWTKTWNYGNDVNEIMEKQIRDYMKKGEYL